MKNFEFNGIEITPETEIQCAVAENPKRKNSNARARFDDYMGATTVREYLVLSGGVHGIADLKYDLGKQFFEIVSE